MAGREVVGAVEHDRGRLHRGIQCVAVEARIDRDDLHLRVERGQSLPPGQRLGLADARLGVQDLPLQVGQIDPIAVGQRQPSDAGAGQIEGRRRAQPASADHQCMGGADARLALDADLFEQDVARVAQQVVVSHRGGVT